MTGKSRSRTKSEGYHSSYKPKHNARRTSEGGAMSISVASALPTSQALDVEGNKVSSSEHTSHKSHSCNTDLKSKIRDMKRDEPEDTGPDLDATLVPSSVSQQEEAETASKSDSDVFLDSSESSDDTNRTLNVTLQDQERRRHLDLRLRALKDAEHKLDHCIRMVRGLFHVVPALHQRLPGRSLPKTSSRRPCTLFDINERQRDFEKRAVVFYEVVQDIKELRSDPDFTRWIAAAIRKFRD